MRLNWTLNIACSTCKIRSCNIDHTKIYMDQKRKRSIVLTPEAQELIRIQVAKVWQENGDGRKFTREVQAEILGVSVATATRMLSGSGIDRASAQIACRNINLEWNAAYVVERVDLTSDSNPTEPSIKDDSSISAHTSNQSSNRTWRFYLVFGLTVVGFSTATFGLVSKISHLGMNRQEEIEFERVLQQRAYQLFSASNYVDALPVGEVAVKKARELGLQEDLGINLRTLADIYDALGRSKDAIRSYEEADQIFTSLGEAPHIPPVCEALGMALLRAKQYDQASRYLWKAYIGWDAQHLHVGRAMAARDLGALALERQHAKEAITWYDEAENLLPGAEEEELRMDIRAQRSVANAELGSPGTAIDQLKRCEQFWGIKNHRRWIATTRLQLGQVMFLTRNLTEANEFLNQSLRGFELCGDLIGIRKVKEIQNLLQPLVNKLP